MTIGEYIKIHQPAVYALLISWIYVDQAEESSGALREIEKLMSHSAYKRINGAIRQVRHG